MISVGVGISSVHTLQLSFPWKRSKLTQLVIRESALIFQDFSLPWKPEWFSRADRCVLELPIKPVGTHHGKIQVFQADVR